MRTILWFIYFWLYLIKLLPDQIHAKALEKAGNKEALDILVAKVVRNWARGMLNMAGVKVIVTGMENIPNEPAVFVSNHQGNFDIPILLGSLDKPKSFVAKMELKKMPMIRTWMKYLHCIFIDRSDPRQSLTALGNASEVLDAGYSIIIFPEGTRSKSENLGEFKSGALKMAFKTGAPIVPVSIIGSYKIMEQQGMWIRPGTVELKVLPPIDTKDMTKEQTRAVGDEIRRMILESR